MNMTCRTAVVMYSLFFSACVTPQVFSPETMEGVDKSFDFRAWRIMPNEKTGKKVELGGRIIHAEAKEGAVVLAVAELPIVEHPAYGPKESGKRNGEFLVLYKGELNPNAMQPGNRLIVVGTTQNAQVVTVDDIQRRLPSVVADCVHIWNTGGRAISDFPSYGGGYQPLVEETFCVTAS